MRGGGIVCDGKKPAVKPMNLLTACGACNGRKAN